MIYLLLVAAFGLVGCTKQVPIKVQQAAPKKQAVSKEKIAQTEKDLKVVYKSLANLASKRIKELKPQEQPLAVNQLRVDHDFVLPIGPHYSMYQGAGLEDAQAWIDSDPYHHTGTGHHPMLVNDNMMTLIYGHNPGIMTEMSEKLHIGSIIEICDMNGQTRSYKVEKMGTNKNKIYNGGVFEWSQFYDNLLDYEIDQHEGIIIQFCRGTDLELWCAYPIN